MDNFVPKKLIPTNQTNMGIFAGDMKRSDSVIILPFKHTLCSADFVFHRDSQFLGRVI